MNRKILYRGKWVDTGEWVYGSIIHKEEESPVPTLMDKYSAYFICTFSVYDCDLLVYPESVGQYTGMKDKNKNKIFEGDILKFQTPDGSIRYFVVEWCTNDRKLMPLSGFEHDGHEVRINGWCFVWKGYALYPTVIDGIPDNEVMEIVGNVYDNPELIENEK